jgi:hypothetical protein
VCIRDKEFFPQISQIDAEKKRRWPAKARRRKEKILPQRTRRAWRKIPCALSETFAIIAVKNIPRRRENAKKNFYLRGHGEK